MAASCSAVRRPAGLSAWLLACAAVLTASPLSDAAGKQLLAAKLSAGQASEKDAAARAADLERVRSLSARQMQMNMREDQVQWHVRVSGAAGVRAAQARGSSEP